LGIDRTHPPSWLAFAPPALPGFFATMQPLTSVSQLPDPLTNLLASRHLNFPPFRLQPPQGASRCLDHVTQQALCFLQAESSSSSYRLVVLLLLLPTPPHDDAVAVGYGPENVCPVGTFTLQFKCAHERTRRRLKAPNPECRSLSGRYNFAENPKFRTGLFSTRSIGDAFLHTEH
jgi:hypothetical protein